MYRGFYLYFYQCHFYLRNIKSFFSTDKTVRSLAIDLLLRLFRKRMATATDGYSPGRLIRQKDREREGVVRSAFSRIDASYERREKEREREEQAPRAR